MEPTQYIVRGCDVYAGRASASWHVCTCISSQTAERIAVVLSAVESWNVEAIKRYGVRLNAPSTIGLEQSQ